MTYREKLELYSQGKLDEQQKIEIEKELEKQEALTDYLFEHQAPPGMDDLFDGTSPFAGDEGGDAHGGLVRDDSEQIAKQINSSIRRAFIKTGVIATIIAMILTLFIVFALPHIVSAFYYDPGKIIEDTEGTTIDTFERDLSVYAEIAFPELGPRITAATDGYGYGNYRFYVDASFEVGSDDNNRTVDHLLMGNIKRDEVTCYNYDDLAVFERENFFLKGKEAKDTTKNMNASNLYYTYVTFDKPMSYEPFYAKFAENNEYGTDDSWVWCGVKVSAEEDCQSTCYGEGFYAAPTPNDDYSRFNYDQTKYPDLSWRSGMVLDTEAKAATHFKSMLQFMTDNSDYTAVGPELGPFSETFENAQQYISENGINVYGFLYVSDKEHVENVKKAEGVAQVAVLKID